MTEKSILEQALLQVQNLEEAVKTNAKGILASTMKEELSELLKESKKEEEEEKVGKKQSEPKGKKSKEEEKDVTDDESGDDLDDKPFKDIDSADDDSDSTEDDEYSSTDDDNYPTDDDDTSLDYNSMAHDSDQNVMDLTKASNSEVLKVFKAMSSDDEITVTKDGVTVAKSINLYDPTENLAVIMMRQAADKTATVAGDGTTTSIVLAEAIIDAADKYINPEHNVTEVIRKINSITKNVVSNLDKRSKKVSGRRLYDVATISANNDPEIGKMIGDAFSEVSLVTVENSMNSETRVEIINGMRIERGYTSTYFINDHKKQECVLENPYVLICDHEINNISNLEKILAPIVSQGRSLLIIGNLGPNALQTLNVNVYQGKIKACNIIPPSFGYRQKDLLKDLAVALGGTYFSEDTGDDLSIINLVDLGRASKIIVKKDMTVFMHNSEVKEEIDNHIVDLKSMIDQIGRAHV